MQQQHPPLPEKTNQVPSPAAPRLCKARRPRAGGPGASHRPHAEPGGAQEERGAAAPGNGLGGSPESAARPHRVLCFRKAPFHQRRWHCVDLLPQSSMLPAHFSHSRQRSKGNLSLRGQGDGHPGPGRSESHRPAAITSGRPVPAAAAHRALGGARSVPRAPAPSARQEPACAQAAGGSCPPCLPPGPAAHQAPRAGQPSWGPRKMPGRRGGAASEDARHVPVGHSGRHAQHFSAVGRHRPSSVPTVPSVPQPWPPPPPPIPPRPPARLQRPETRAGWGRKGRRARGGSPPSGTASAWGTPPGPLPPAARSAPSGPSRRSRPPRPGADGGEVAAGPAAPPGFPASGAAAALRRDRLRAAPRARCTLRLGAWPWLEPPPAALLLPLHHPARLRSAAART